MINICSFALGKCLSIKSDRDYDRKGKYLLADVETENLGKTFGDETAGDGFSYYRITGTVANIGQYSERCRNISFRVVDADTGADCWREYEDYGAVEYDMLPVAPAGRTAQIQAVMRIPEDCERITVSFPEEVDGEGEITIQKDSFS